MIQIEETAGDQTVDNVGSSAEAVVLLDNSDEEPKESIAGTDNRVTQHEGDTLDVGGSLIGVKRHNYEAMYELYCQHAREVGFSVRKNTQRTNKVGEVVEKYYVCSNEGLRRTTTLGNSNNQNKKTVRKTNFTRTDCKAMLRVKKCSDDLFEVVEHIVDHNHVLSRKEWSHMHRSERRITSEKAILIEDMIASGIRASDSYRYMAAKAGGEHLVGHTMKDHLNFANRMKRNGIKRNATEVVNAQKGCNTSEKAVLIEDMTGSKYRDMVTKEGGEQLVVGHMMKDHLNLTNKMKRNAIELKDAQSLIDHLNFTNKKKRNTIEVEDAQSLIDVLCQEGTEDEDFYYRFKLDDDGRLSNVFWRDSMMSEDYQIYGDVVVFDTTYRTNKYNWICAPFFGLNNHRRNVMFGCAFISDEKTETFEWLFEAFKKSMKVKFPEAIFTDQDLAITNAAAKVFPEARHMLCIWNLYQNAVNRFYQLKGNKNFNDDFQKCLTGCVNKQEFEDCWASMIFVYDLKENSWFARLYELREKWCTAYNKDLFYAEILSSSQRSERTNNAIGFKANKSTNLYELHKVFKTTVQRWRSREQVDEFECSRAMPDSRIALTGMLKHASEVYTIAVFHDFEDEFLKSISTTVNVVGEELDIKVYDVQNHDVDTPHKVNFFSRESIITCTCRRFEECGLLCCHCLRILDRNSVQQIPSCYIKRRWAKFAKKDLWDKVANSRATDSIPWRHKMAMNYYSLLIKAQANESTRKIVEDEYENMYAAVEALTAHHMIEETNALTSSTNMLDPSKKANGRKKRIKEHMEKRKEDESQ